MRLISNLTDCCRQYIIWSRGGRLSGEALNDIAKNATGYLGVVILKNKKGNWVQSNMGMAINFDEVNALKELSFWLENAEICQKNL